MSTYLSEHLPPYTLDDDATASLEHALAAAPTPLCTPAADLGELRQRLDAGERSPAVLLRSTATAPMPGDAALLGALVQLRVPRADLVVEGDVAVPLDQSVYPARGHVVVPGSLHVRGNLEVVAPLVVCGDLVVDGGIVDCGPQSVIVVLGSLRCCSLRTTGEILVVGDLDATHFVWGHYNDNVLEVHGTLRTPVSMSDDHGIEAGTLEVVHHPPEGGAWGNEIFDMSTAHVAALAALMSDPACIDADGNVDVAHLATLASPWSSRP